MTDLKFKARSRKRDPSKRNTSGLVTPENENQCIDPDLNGPVFDQSSQAGVQPSSLFILPTVALTILS